MNAIIFNENLDPTLRADIQKAALSYANALTVWHIDGSRGSWEIVCLWQNQLNDLCHEAANSLLECSGVV